MSHMRVLLFTVIKKIEDITSVGEDEERREALYIVGEHVDSYNHYAWNIHGDALKQ